MPTRADLLSAATEAESIADELADHADLLFRGMPEARNAEIAATLIGVRARNGIRAIRALGEVSADDQVAILGRALTEAALDLEYLRTPTTRLVSGQSIFLRTVDKEELFLTSLIIAEKRIRGDVLSVPPEELTRALALRERLGLSGSSRYWHAASGTKAILDELKSHVADQVKAAMLDNIYHMFRLFSLNAHTSPFHAAYFSERPGGGWPWSVSREYRADESVAGSLLMAVIILNAWGEAINYDVSPQATELVKRLGFMGGHAAGDQGTP